MKSFTATQLNKAPQEIFAAAKEDGAIEIKHDRFNGGVFAIVWNEQQSLADMAEQLVKQGGFKGGDGAFKGEPCIGNLPKLHKDDILIEHPVMGALRVSRRNMTNDAGELISDIRIDCYKKESDEFIVFPDIIGSSPVVDFIEKAIPFLLAEWNKADSSPDHA
jgi:hypothetical protein